MSDTAAILRQKINAIVGDDPTLKAVLGVGYSLALDDAVAMVNRMAAADCLLGCDTLADALVELSAKGPVL